MLCDVKDSRGLPFRIVVTHHYQKVGGVTIKNVTFSSRHNSATIRFGTCWEIGLRPQARRGKSLQPGNMKKRVSLGG